jgi:hypothetical protein
MNVSLHPILKECRAIYDLDGVMERFNSYVGLMTQKAGEILPLGDFSPMGKRQKEFLDLLLTIEAEEVASVACRTVCEEINSNDSFRVMLVVVDEASNGWTQRFLTDADWRFTDKIASLPKKNLSSTFDRWVAVNLWTTDSNMQPMIATAESVVLSTRAALFRAYWQRLHGIPITLEETLRQEGATLNFAGEKVSHSEQEITESWNSIAPLLSSKKFPEIFAAMYGDEAALNSGYECLGLKPMAGFQVAMARFTT